MSCIFQALLSSAGREIKKKIRRYYFLKFPLTKLYFNGPFNAQMDKGITSVIELYRTPSQRPSLKTLKEKWFSIAFSVEYHLVCLKRKKANKFKKKKRQEKYSLSVNGLKHVLQVVLTILGLPSRV